MDLRKRLRKLSPERLILLGLIALGLVLRLRQFLIGRSLWLDEAMLALNIVGRSYAGLLAPLDYNQGAPVGFLLAEKLIITLLGNHEDTLRLLPMLAGCAALVLFALLLRQALGKIGTALALALFAIGVPLIYYSSEVKQYSLDVFFALLLFWLAGRIILGEAPAEGGHGHEHVLLAVTGTLAVWFSHPALFVVAATGATLLVHFALQKDRGRLRQIAAITAIWVISFAVLYLVSLRGLASNAFLHNYWAEAFMPQPPWANPDWFVETLKSRADDPLGLGSFWVLTELLMLIGLISLARRKWQFAALFGLTLAALLAASELGVYPFAGRMILFSVPVFLALLGAGVEAVAGWFQGAERLPPGLQGSRLSGIVITILAVLLLYQPVPAAFQNFTQPRYSEHIRPDMDFLRANYRPGDKIYVYYWALPAYRYYAPFYDLSNVRILAGHNWDDNPRALLLQISRLRGNSRVWLLFSHVSEKAGVNQMKYALTRLDVIGQRRRIFVEPGTSVYLYLYDLRNIDLPVPK